MENEAAAPLGLGARIMFVAMLLLFGGAGWWLHLRPNLESDPTTVEAIPIEMQDWSGRDIPLSAGVEIMLRADSQLQRMYENPDGEIVWVYVGYYGTKRGGRPEHTPWVCYPSAGWEIERKSELALSIPLEPEEDARINEILVERDGERRLVHFWYATHRSTAIASEFGLTLDHVAGRVSADGRADGALVRISTPVGGRGLESARKRLEAFAIPLVPEIERHWPSARQVL